MLSVTYTVPESVFHFIHSTNAVLFHILVSQSLSCELSDYFEGPFFFSPFSCPRCQCLIRCLNAWKVWGAKNDDWSHLISQTSTIIPQTTTRKITIWGRDNMHSLILSRLVIENRRRNYLLTLCSLYAVRSETDSAFICWNRKVCYCHCVYIQTVCNGVSSSLKRRGSEVSRHPFCSLHQGLNKFEHLWKVFPLFWLSGFTLLGPYKDAQPTPLHSTYTYQRKLSLQCCKNENHHQPYPTVYCILTEPEINPWCKLFVEYQKHVE